MYLVFDVTSSCLQVTGWEEVVCISPLAIVDETMRALCTVGKNMKNMKFR